LAVVPVEAGALVLFEEGDTLARLEVLGEGSRSAVDFTDVRPAE
jgi:hypothetical protein